MGSLKGYSFLRQSWVCWWARPSGKPSEQQLAQLWGQMSDKVWGTQWGTMSEQQWGLMSGKQSDNKSDTQWDS